MLVLGGGFSGMVSTIKLLEAGITDVKIIEKGGDFGGTCGLSWSWFRCRSPVIDLVFAGYWCVIQTTANVYFCLI